MDSKLLLHYATCICSSCIKLMMKFLTQGRIQFYVDAIDRPVAMATSGISETLAIINRFPIDLELTPGASFTERMTYTGIYNISDLGFDMSFRVQCTEKYYSPNCTTLCEPMEGVYTCDSEGRVVCLQSNYDPTTSCTQCLPGWNQSTNCNTCRNRDFDPSTNCTECLHGYDPASNCTSCLPNFIQIGNRCSGASTVEDSKEVTSTETIDSRGEIQANACKLSS